MLEGFDADLDVPAETLHDRAPLIFGGASQVEAIEAVQTPNWNSSTDKGTRHVPRKV